VTFAELRETARHLNSQIVAAVPSWGTGTLFDADPGLLGRIVSRMALATGGRELRHIAVDGGDESLRVTLFLDASVIDASYKEDALIVDVLPLDIRSMRVTATQDALDDDRFDPEQPVAVNVTLAEGRTLTLRGTGDEGDPLGDYLPTLFGKTAAH
jgi:hypothetical protein